MWVWISGHFSAREPPCRCRRLPSQPEPAFTCRKFWF
ncbi:hypothetical protein SLEP1_g14951 [Rubroshorea leprosula]|uniref:Uncharacterized protein n=1 Tax=Rubroshorea leprosula TaxID=152421 RepID=A0AAV5IW82_9ROSI|nr:hypothetical protein SLEP1_g14951 [Rubroshorea leprosula]